MIIPVSPVSILKRQWLMLALLVQVWAGLAKAQENPAVTETAPQPLVKTPLNGLPVGRFLTDTIDIGRPFQYTLSFWHRAGEDVFFPDTSSSFTPFRVLAMSVFPTRTQQANTPGAMSLDSALYTLVSFSTRPLQPLQVPVRMTNGPDSVILLATPDTIFLRSHLRSAAQPQTLSLITETAVVPLRQQFNYPYLLLALLTLSVALGIVYGLFNQAIRRQWQLYKIDQRHIRFLKEFNRLTLTINADSAAEVANKAIIRWKTYLERLEKQSYSSLTSREIADRFGDEYLTEALRETDQIIYGGAFSEQSQSALRVLRETADQLYQQQRDLMRQPTRRMAESDSTTNAAV